MAYNSAMPDFIYERAKSMVRSLANHQFNSMPVPEITVDEALHLFYDPADTSTMKRMADLAPRKKGRETLRIVMPVDTNGSNYNIDVRLESSIPYMLPDEMSHPIDWECPVIARLRRWAEWRHATAQNWALVAAGINWMYQHPEMTPNQFKAAWQGFPDVLRSPQQPAYPDDVGRWVNRFKNLSGNPRRWLSGYPGEFKGGREGWREIRNVINRIALLSLAPEQDNNFVTVNIHENNSTYRVLIEGWADRSKSPFLI